MHKIQKILILVSVLTIFAFGTCLGGGMKQEGTQYTNLKDVPQKVWEKLSKKNIFFGHQSVGYNIMDGVEDLMHEYPMIKINVVETKNIKNSNAGVFAHSRVGQNTDAKSKIKDFHSSIEKGMGESADIVMLKFCYVDIYNDQSIDAAFQEYINKVEEIKNQYPDIEIIHFTVPLRATKLSMKIRLKNLIKKIIGRYVEDNEATNIARNQYNSMIIKEYAGKDAIFNIAEIESTLSDGSRSSYEKNGSRYFSLAPEYTDDGGHLNKLGRKLVAEKLLLFIASFD